MNLSTSTGINSARAVPCAPTLANVIGSSIGCYLDGFLIDPKKTAKCNEITTKSLAECDLIRDGNFMFHTIHFYARPIQGIGAHNIENDEKTSEEANKNNAQKASNGYHHGLLILSYGDPVPTQCLLDRVEGVRFIKINDVEEKELTSGHLILIREYNVDIKYKTIKSFIEKESLINYNAAQNNCLHFVYKFIDQIIDKNEWNKDFNAFWKYIARHFDVEDIEKGKYNEQQNHFQKELSKKKLLLEHKIKEKLAKKDETRRYEWDQGDKLLIQSKNYRAIKSWYIGEITKINVDEIYPEYTTVVVTYEKMGKTFKTKPIRVVEPVIKPYIQIPSSFLDPITYKVMTDPVQILRSGQIYDAITVQYMQKVGMVCDPITGIIMAIGHKKPFVEKQTMLKDSTQKFMDKHKIDQKILNDFKSVKSEEVWDIALQKLQDRYDIEQQQQKIYKQTELVFYPAELKLDNEQYKGWRFGKKMENNVDAAADDDDEKKIDINDNDKQTLLRWNADHMFINHTSIPIITCMGPSRIGKSFLLNEILRSQQKWKNDKTLQEIDVFETSDSGDIVKTKGAWISLFGDKYDDEKIDDHHLLLIDQWPEDDISMWSTEDIIYWFNSLNPQFDKTYPKLKEHIKSSKLNGRMLSECKLNDINKLIKTGDMSKTDEDALVNILRKRIQNKMDEIEWEKISQMYLVDMEGLSHGVTQFTHKIFHGCYAISNVVIWFDEAVNSDKFKVLMNELKQSMEVVAKSTRKPAFIYLLRNADTLDYDFKIPDDIDCDDAFDYYIHHSVTFKEFRNMNIFSSIHGYQFQSPVNLIKPNWKRGGKKSTKKQKLCYNHESLNELIKKIKFVSNKTKRFAHSTHILNDQVNNINQYSALSPEKRIALCNSRLKWFVLIDKSNDPKKSKERQLQIKNAIITFNENIHSVKENFETGYQSLNTQLQLKSLAISERFGSQLTKNKNEIISEIQKRTQNAKKADNYESALNYVVENVVMFVPGLTCLSAGAALLVFGTAAAVSGGLYLVGQSYRPETLDKIEETELDELNTY